MPHPAQPVILDTWAILAYFQDEPAAAQVEELITSAQAKESPLLISVVNAGEIWYILAREASEQDADRSILELNRLGIRFVDIDWNLAHAAAVFKAGYSMSYAYCFAAALAKVKSAPLVTGDVEFEQLEGKIEIHWLMEK